MQKFLLSLLTSCSFLCAFTQTTNTFPSTGSAGIGITSPTPGVALDILNTPAGGDVGINISAIRTGTVYSNSFMTFGSPRSGTADGSTIVRRGYLVTPGTSATTAASFFIGANTANAVTTGDVTAIRGNQSNIEISSSAYVDFWKAGTNYARINGNGNSYFTGGNIGIGTTTPGTALDVTGTVRSSLFMAASASPTDQLTHNGVSMSHYGLGWMNDSWQSGSSTAWLSGYGGIKLFTGGQNRLNINYAGNVGIGGQPDNAKLTVTTSNSSPLSITGNTSSYIGSDISISRSSSAASVGQSPAIQFNDGSNGSGSWIVQASSNGFQFFSYVGGWYEKMRLTQDGNLLINKTSQVNSSYKLDVAGNIRADKLVVNTTGADFVFEPNYKLTPLTQLEQYVTANHHLPGIETAKTMQKDGVDVGTNQTKLLQKIEELTLYAIEQEKQQKHTLSQLEAQNKTIVAQQDLLQQQQQLLQQLRKELDELKASKK